MSQRLIGAKKSKTSTRKALTFEQINPKWCHIIHREPATKQVEFVQNHSIINLTNPKYCVVGEAHGNTRDYFDYQNDDFCQNCFNHSLRFPYLMEDPPAERQLEVNRFVEHWNECHV